MHLYPACAGKASAAVILYNGKMKSCVAYNAQLYIDLFSLMHARAVHMLYTNAPTAKVHISGSIFTANATIRTHIPTVLYPMHPDCFIPRTHACLSSRSMRHSELEDERGTSAACGTF